MNYLVRLALGLLLSASITYTGHNHKKLDGHTIVRTYEEEEHESSFEKCFSLGGITTDETRCVLFDTASSYEIVDITEEHAGSVVHQGNIHH